MVYVHSGFLALFSQGSGAQIAFGDEEGGGGGVGTPEAEPLESVQLQSPPLVLPLDGNYLQCEGRVVFLFSVYYKEEVTYNLKSRFIPRLYIQNISHDRRHHYMHTLTLTHHTRVSNSF